MNTTNNVLISKNISIYFYYIQDENIVHLLSIFLVENLRSVH